MTERLFGTAITPHSFRSIAATASAEAFPEDALHARPLLGHRRPRHDRALLREGDAAQGEAPSSQITYTAHGGSEITFSTSFP
jgi:hypothetical protein